MLKKFEIIRNVEPRMYQGNYIVEKCGKPMATFMLRKDAEDYLMTGNMQAAIFKFIS